jgi:hypothetical protein
MTEARAESTINRLLVDVPLMGLKGVATRIFKEFGMFPKNMLLFEGRACKEKMTEELPKSSLSRKPLTVRFSFDKKLSLPTGFFKNWQEAASFVEQKCQPSWFCIVHEYIDLQHSFRLYVDKEKKIMEHIPGMWDSDNRSSPDIIISQEDYVYLYRYRNTRSVKLMKDWKPTWLECSPVEFDEMRSWLSYVRRYDKIIRLLAKHFRPFACYFVTDVDDVPYFLNIYETGVVGIPEEKSSELHVVASLTDLETWDGQKNILLRVTAERSRQDEIYLIAGKLANTTAIVYTDFGALSHPAILLREYGVKVVPFYLSHEKQVLNEVES